MPLIRGHHDFDDHFAQIPNDWLRDDRLSLEARGLLAQIMSHRPGWNLSIRSISAQNRIGKDKVRRIIDELMSFEYLERSDKQGKDEMGRMTSYDYITRDPLPRTAEPRAEKPPTVAGPTKNTIPKEEQLEKTSDIEQSFNKFWALYPRKKGKGQARAAFEKALSKTDLETILAGVEAYVENGDLSDSQFVAHPTTWLNGERWEDEYEAARVVSRSPYVGGSREWVEDMHDMGEHFECREGEFGCK